MFSTIFKVKKLFCDYLKLHFLLYFYIICNI